MRVRAADIIGSLGSDPKVTPKTGKRGVTWVSDPGKAQKGGVTDPKVTPKSRERGVSDPEMTSKLRKGGVSDP